MEFKHSLIFTSISNIISHYCAEVIAPYDIKFIPDDDTFLPLIIKKQLTIKYNYRAEIMALLHLCGSATLALNYFFANICYSYNDFNNARYFILRTREQFYEEFKQIAEGYGKFSDRIIYQMLFMVFHEIGHAIFHIYPDVKDDYLELTKSCLKDVMSAYDSIASNSNNRAEIEKIINNHMPLDSIKDQLKGLANDLDIKDFFKIDGLMSDYAEIENNVTGIRSYEELGCDIFAIHTLKLLSTNLGFPNQQIKELYAAEQTAIQFLAQYSYWEQLYIKQDAKSYAKKGIDLIRILSAHTMICHHFNDIDSEISNYVMEVAMENIPIIFHANEMNYIKSIKDRFNSLSNRNIDVNKEDKDATFVMLEYLNNEIISLLSLISANKGILCIAGFGNIDVSTGKTTLTSI